MKRYKDAVDEESMFLLVFRNKVIGFTDFLKKKEVFFSFY